MTSVQLREALISDLDFIVACNLAMAKETEDKGLCPDTLRAGVAAALQDPSKGSYFIAQVADECVGTLMVTTEWSDWRNAHFWWIQSVYVLKHARGKGVYGALHRDVLQRATAQSAVVGVRLYVEKENDHARGVYQRLGMHVCEYDMMEQLTPPTASTTAITSS
jgi:GNAT superfamily N-acetyltransferase